MSDNIENQLRTQLEQQLNEKQSEIVQTESTLKVLVEEAEVLLNKISRFDEVFGTGGRKPTVRPVITIKKPQATVKKPTTTAAPKVNNSRAAQGRRDVAAGLRPKIKQAMMLVMGDRTTNASVIYEELKVRDWLPNSNDPRAYIAYLLSSLKDAFERVEGRGRGFYRVRPAETTPAPTAKTVKTGLSETDAILQDAGVLPAN